jgi:parallel beta-helix repeat protein
VDAVVGLKPVSNQKIYLSDNAVLKAKPNSAGSYNVFNIYDKSNVTIEGGAILGERYNHSGASGEWGNGIGIRGGKNIVVKNVTVKDCWGDGIYVGKGSYTSENIQIFNSICDGNRRQGISIVSCKGALVQGCTLRNTKGTEPQSGIDIEVNTGETVSDIKVDSCTAYNNAGDGILAYGGFATQNNITITNCTSYNNGRTGIKVDVSPYSLVEGNTLKGNGTYGLWVNNTNNVTVRGNQIFENKWHGIRVLQSRNCTIAKNTLTANGQAGNNAYDNICLEYNSDSNIVQENTCRMGTLANKSRYGVNIAVSTDDNNQILYNDLVNSVCQAVLGMPAPAPS